MRIIILLMLIILWSACEKKFKEAPPEPSSIDVEAVFNEALTLMDAKKYTEAQALFLQLDTASPDIVGVKMNLAVIEENIGSTKAAIRYAEEAYRLSPNNVAVTRYLEHLTGEEDYAQKLLELKNKVIDVDAETYFEAFREESPIINQEYIHFEIRMTGTVTVIDKEQQLLYLYGAGETVEEGVICLGLPDELFDEVNIGERITFIGFSYGQGEDSMEPLIAFKRME